MNQQQTPPPLIAECHDTSERIDLYENYGLYIKPIARLNITVQLPPYKVPGQGVPNSEILDKIKKQASPDEFIYLRVIKSTPEFMRCEGEVENKSSFKTLLARLDGCAIKMSAFADVVKVRAAEAKLVYPTRHDWDSFYKDAMNPGAELKPGERPDTVHFVDLPCKWFADRKAASADAEKPCESVLQEVFSIFGEIRMVEIPPEGIIRVPALKRVGSSLANELSMLSEITLPTFEAYIQYKDYISFVKAMDTFRGMKMLYIENKSEAYTANIRVDFDRTRRLSDKEIKRREIDKFKEIEIQKIRHATLEKEKEKENKQREIANFRALLEESMGADSGDGMKGENSEEKTKEQRRREREEIRRQKRFAQKKQEEEKKFQQKVALEERKILIAHRKLESMRLLEELFNRVKVLVAEEELDRRQKEKDADDLKKQTEEADELETKRLRLQKEELELKERIARKAHEQELAASEIKQEEVEHFELRKTVHIKMESSNESPEKAGSSMPHMPRAVLLSNPQLLYPPKAPKLYDEDDLTPSSVDGVLESKDGEASHGSTHHEVDDNRSQEALQN